MVLMTEQQQNHQTLLSTPAEEIKSVKSPGKKDSKGIASNSEAENAGEEKQKRPGKTSNDQPQPSDNDTEPPENRKKPSLVMSKTFDLPSPQIPSDFETKLERKKSQTSQFSKTNAQFHKIFKEICKEEQLKQSYTCALQKDILYQGRLFVSENWICFHSKVFGKDTKIAIPVTSVTLIKKTKTAILVPNALVIATAIDRHVFVSFLSRETTYKFLKSTCFHLDGKSPGSSPIPSSTENSFRVERPASLPLDFPGDFSDLDGTVRQRRQEMEESTSSGSQTPEFETISEFPNISQNFLNVVRNGEIPVHADIHVNQNPDVKFNPHRNGASGLVRVVHTVKSLWPMSLNTLLLVYLFFVCILVISSCYMAYKIMTLEQRLTSLGSMAEYRQNENLVQHSARVQAEVNAEMYGELSSNLLKLEKIQKNLQRLLEETE
ncbi:GRAM domain-containing protein 2B isoform X2 [Lepisosteus oculatus]|uniref:GRAM domain-containing protein 2B isoform X2 n=1 Tax=Lepisosteus oculatus TaxID=7918 RepID=UPI00073FB4E2|nr:PREDICTED: GRAM domain-containing protein 3 isoform X2 [Lepisosteus oculatus]